METNKTVSAGKAQRSAYLDNLRTWVIFLVVAMHSNVTYSGMGGWYYKEGREASLDAVSRVIFGFYGSFTQAWFMGILFFIAAVFAGRSLSKRGTTGFIRERAFRLGVPLLIYMFVIEPFIGYFLLNSGNIRARYPIHEAWLGYVASFDWVGSTGPLWFAEALLAACILYALYRAVRPARTDRTEPPKSLTLVLIILATGLVAFSIRLFYPIGTSVLNLQFSFFASYIALFLLGINAGERGWLEAAAGTQGMRWFTWTLALGIPLWFALMAAGGALSGRIPIEGGLYWQSFAYAFWESFIAIGLSVGCIAFFRKYLGFENRVTRTLAANAFGIYLFHAPILIALSLLLKDWHAPLLLKHAAVAPLAFTASLGFSSLVRLIPGLRSVLK